MRNRNELVKNVVENRGIESVCDTCAVDTMTVESWLGGVPVGDRCYFELVKCELWLSAYILAKYEKKPILLPENNAEAMEFWEGFQVGALSVIQYCDNEDWIFENEALRLLKKLDANTLGMVRSALAEHVTLIVDSMIRQKKAKKGGDGY